MDLVSSIVKLPDSEKSDDSESFSFGFNLRRGRVHRGGLRVHGPDLGLGGRVPAPQFGQGLDRGRIL